MPYVCSGEKYLPDLLAYRDMALDTWCVDPCNGVTGYIETICDTEK